MDISRFETDVVVIGAGVIGLACARQFALQGKDVIVIEAEPHIAVHTSSRNSEVIHAGIYYAEGSNKAKFCVQGRRQLYTYLDRAGVTYRKCGKLVVAIDAHERQTLENVYARALANDVEGLSLIDGNAARKIEPALGSDITAALHSEVSGIMDSHAFFLALQGEIEDHGGMIAFGTPVMGGEVTPTGVVIRTGGSEPAEITAKTVINAAGHMAMSVAASIDGPHTGGLPKPRYVKGSYFTISGKTPFQRLIYPVPTSSSLGLHLTVDLAGRGKLGPDAEWLPDGAKPPFDYRVDPGRRDHFYESARRYWPTLKPENLNPDYSGVRPKLVGPGEPSGDFQIRKEKQSGLVNLFGIESPGLTSSLAIAGHVAELVDSDRISTLTAT